MAAFTGASTGRARDAAAHRIAEHTQGIAPLAHVARVIGCMCGAQPVLFRLSTYCTITIHPIMIMRLSSLRTCSFLIDIRFVCTLSCGRHATRSSRSTDIDTERRVADADADVGLGVADRLSYAYVSTTTITCAYAAASASGTPYTV